MDSNHRARFCFYLDILISILGLSYYCILYPFKASSTLRLFKCQTKANQWYLLTMTPPDLDLCSLITISDHLILILLEEQRSSRQYTIAGHLHVLSTIYSQPSVTVPPEKHPTQDYPNNTPTKPTVPLAPAPRVGSSKRPASCMQDKVNDWDNVSPMGLSMHSSINIPYAHYAIIYLNNIGRLKVMESPSIQEKNKTIFTTEVCERFLEILSAKVGYQPPMVQRLSAAGATAYSYDPQQPLSNLNSLANSMYGVPPSIPFSVPVEEMPSYGSVHMVRLKISDTPRVAKAFIKFIKPGKQVKHPYNRGKPPAGARPALLTDLEYLSLLIHIICKLRRFGITIDQLQEIAHDCKQRLSDPNKLQILDEVFEVRRIKECYKRGEVNANKIVYIKEKDGDSNVDLDQKHEQEDDNADEVLPILYSKINSTSLMLSSVKHIGMWLSFSKTPQDNQTFFPTTSKTPVITALVSPNETPAAFNYITQAPITSSTLDTSPSHAMSQATMLYQLPRSLTSHPQEMPHIAHSLPNLP
ncbi:uncharacterized protein P174DRAFT_457091 [Aspergillus novofumigatus IBT 16806]|uniref:Subtelomeric hrmA-associated cluster protein AFUB-079030/YDR124W-like helical bundle domain-containing protein n=1 Tax=Aspergillus novofumigatus (strain IBT 16806) TaxID=1392255 RepID=A0A2I1CF97_ASPN1|nr:uncharacterized protein P174DRAFT_457091 [Aspergillus novofumigatus IBT 16806]PKX96281.1 hypothetical protein P174DRAFT_457091 [Aspergillus novofumigatus IBT 16806]